MDFRELIKVKEVDVKELSKKTNNRIAKFNQTLKAYNIQKNEKAKATMAENMEFMNEDIVDDILLFLDDKEKANEPIPDPNIPPTPPTKNTPPVPPVAETNADSNDNDDDVPPTPKKSFFRPIGW